MICNLCPRKCSAERTDEQNIKGICKMPLLPRVARATLHFWEEPCISGTNGSGTVFFSGCPLKCVFCQNFSLSKDGFGEIVSVERLAEIFRELEQKGANNINLVTPTHYVHAIIKALEIYKPNIPIVYNSGGYDSVEALKALENYIDIYLLDLKYMSSERAKRYSLAYDYPTVSKNAILEAYRQKSTPVIENGIMKSGVIVRHLILPQGTNDAINVFNWVKDNLPNAYFSIMSQYVPCGNLEKYPEINRKITRREYEKVLNHICSTDFNNCYFQELSSSSKDYIPDFDLTGIKKI